MQDSDLIDTITVYWIHRQQNSFSLKKYDKNKKKKKKFVVALFGYK